MSTTNGSTSPAITKISVWDTYLQKEDGTLMHFDILVPTTTSEEEVKKFGAEYLQSKGLPPTENFQKCQFCHYEPSNPQIEAAINQQGYYILELEGCN